MRKWRKLIRRVDGRTQAWRLAVVHGGKVGENSEGGGQRRGEGKICCGNPKSKAEVYGREQGESLVKGNNVFTLEKQWEVSKA